MKIKLIMAIWFQHLESVRGEDLVRVRVKYSTQRTSQAAAQLFDQIRTFPRTHHAHAEAGIQKLQKAGFLHHEKHKKREKQKKKSLFLTWIPPKHFSLSVCFP